MYLNEMMSMSKNLYHNNSFYPLDMQQRTGPILRFQQTCNHHRKNNSDSLKNIWVAKAEEKQN